MTSLNTRELLKDKSNKLGTGDSGCNEAEDEMDRGKSAVPRIDSKVTSMGCISTSAPNSKSTSVGCINISTSTISANKLDRLESYSHTDNDADGSGEEGKEEVEIDRGKSSEMEMECLSLLEMCCQNLCGVASEMKMEEGAMLEFYPEMRERGNVHGVASNRMRNRLNRIQNAMFWYNKINEAMRDFKLFFLPEDTEAGSRMPNWVRDEVEQKQMTEAGMEDRAKSFFNEQVIGPLPPETDMKGESGKQQQSEFLSPVTLQPDSAMVLKQVQGSNESKPWPTVEDMHRLGLQWEPPRLDEPDPLPDFVMPELPLLELSYPKDDPSGADDDDDMKEEMDRGKSAQQIAQEEKEMVAEAKNFTSYRSFWESSWGADGHGSFEDMTTVSSTHFTHLTPGCSSDSAAIAGATLQIFTIKLKEIKGGLEWPLSVYGVVAARDCVDHNRNLLFSCDRRRSQKLNKDDPFLPLIGPSRAIVFTDPVDFEIQLRVKGRTLSQDRALISDRYHYTGGCNPGLSTICFKNCFCTTELCMERIERTVQASILGVRVKNGPWPFDYGGQVACLSPSRTAEVIGGKITYNTDAPSMEVVLLASRGRKMPRGSYGYLRLSRHVVSVELEGSLNFLIQAYSESGDISAQGEVCFEPKDCNISQETCSFGDPKVEVEITVAWSLLVSAKQRITARGWEFESSDDLELALTGLGV